jgi:hypothetical protein
LFMDSISLCKSKQAYSLSLYSERTLSEKSS